MSPDSEQLSDAYRDCLSLNLSDEIVFSDKHWKSPMHCNRVPEYQYCWDLSFVGLCIQIILHICAHKMYARDSSVTSLIHFIQFATGKGLGKMMRRLGHSRLGPIFFIKSSSCIRLHCHVVTLLAPVAVLPSVTDDRVKLFRVQPGTYSGHQEKNM